MIKNISKYSTNGHVRVTVGGLLSELPKKKQTWAKVISVGNIYVFVYISTVRSVVVVSKVVSRMIVFYSHSVGATSEPQNKGCKSCFHTHYIRTNMDLGLIISKGLPTRY